MAVIAATIKELKLVDGSENNINSSTGRRVSYRALIHTATALTAGDTWAVPTATTKVANITKSGKTVTLRGAAGLGYGMTPGGTAAYALDATISGTTLSGAVGGPTAAAAIAAGTTFGVFVCVDES